MEDATVVAALKCLHRRTKRFKYKPLTPAFKALQNLVKTRFPISCPTNYALHCSETGLPGNISIQRSAFCICLCCLFCLGCFLPNSFMPVECHTLQLTLLILEHTRSWASTCTQTHTNIHTPINTIAPRHEKVGRVVTVNGMAHTVPTR